MSQYLDKEKLLKWLDKETDSISPFRTEYATMLDVFKQIKSGTFDNYAAHNAVAQFDDLEIKLNEANRRIEALEIERDALIQALRDGFADDVQHPTKSDLLYWITSTCPFLEGAFDNDPS